MPIDALASVLHCPLSIAHQETLPPPPPKVAPCCDVHWIHSPYCPHGSLCRPRSRLCLHLLHLDQPKAAPDPEVRSPSDPAERRDTKPYPGQGRSRLPVPKSLAP